MGMCPDGNCPECVAAREKFRREFQPVGDVQGVDRIVGAVVAKQRRERLEEWRSKLDDRAK